MKSRRGEVGTDDDFAQGTALEIVDPEPWPNEVCESHDGLVAEVQRYVGMPKEAAVAAALWVLHSRAHAAVAISPILAITSPVLVCGKTTLLNLLQGLCPRALPASSITPAVLFRAVEKFSPTLVIDGADTYLKGSDELRGILNSGHDRGAAYVIRASGEDYELRLFGTWGPKAIAHAWTISLAAQRFPVETVIPPNCLASFAARFRDPDRLAPESAHESISSKTR